MIEGVTNLIQSHTQHPANSGQAHVGETHAQEQADMKDAVELSSAARQQLNQEKPPLVRQGLVERVRSEIASGTYLTNDKIDAVVNRMHSKLYNTA